MLRARGMQTSMRELADALGVKRPTLYFYFPDLGAVFETVLDQTYQALAEMRDRPDAGWSTTRSTGCARWSTPRSRFTASGRS